MDGLDYRLKNEWHREIKVNLVGYNSALLFYLGANVLDEMIELIIAAYSNMPSGADCYEAAAHVVIQTGVGNYTGRPVGRREWLSQLYEAASRVCSCSELAGISAGVRLDWDMDSLEKLTRCLAGMAKLRASEAAAKVKL